MTKYRVILAYENVPPGEPIEHWETPEYKDGERTLGLQEPIEYEGDLKGAIEQALPHIGYSGPGGDNIIFRESIYAVEEIHGDTATEIDWVAELLKSI